MSLLSSLLKRVDVDETDGRLTQIPIRPIRPMVPAELAWPDEQSADAEETVNIAADAAALEELASEREELLQRARADAETLLAAARLEVAALQDEAEQAGYADGYRAGQEAAKEEGSRIRNDATAEAAEQLRMAAADRTRLLAELGRPLSRIVMSAVSTLLQRELVAEGPDVEQMVGALLRYVSDSSKVEVRVHPDDFSAATAAHAKLQHAKLGEWEVSVVPDATLSRGGCEVRSDSGRVDATLETKLELLESRLESLFERSVTDYVAAERG